MILADRDHVVRLHGRPQRGRSPASGEKPKWRSCGNKGNSSSRPTPTDQATDEERQKADREIRQLEELEQLVTGQEEINSAGFSPDGTLAVTTSTDGSVRLWDWRGRREIGAGPRGQAPAFKSGGGQAWSTAFSPRGDYLVTAGGSDARLWRRSDGCETLRLGPQGAVATAHFSADGTRVVTASWDNVAQDLERQDRPPGTRTARTHASMSTKPSSRATAARVLTVSDDKTAILWDAETGKPLCTFKGHAAAGPQRRPVLRRSLGPGS